MKIRILSRLGSAGSVWDAVGTCFVRENICSDRLGTCFIRKNTRFEASGNVWGRFLSQILLAKKISAPSLETPQRKNIGNRGRQFWRPLSKKIHLDPFPIPQNASWAQKRRTNKGAHNKKNRHLAILIRKPEIANFEDPYRRISTLDVSENDMVWIG